MNYKKKEFKVYLPISNENKFQNPEDDFQLNKIRQAYIKDSSEKTGVLPYDYELDFVKDYGFAHTKDDDNLFNSYYDKNTDINDVLEKYDIVFTFKYINNIDLEQVRNSNSFQKNMFGKFIKYNSLEDYNMDKNINNSSLSDKIYTYGEPLFINDILIYDGEYNKFEYYLYEDFKYNSIPYVITDGSEYRNKNNTFISENALEYKLDGYDIKSPVYIINYSNNINSNELYNKYKLYLYIMKDKIEGLLKNKIENYQIYEKCDDEFGKQNIEYRDIDKKDIIGDYIKVSSRNNKSGQSIKCEISIVSKKS